MDSNDYLRIYLDSAVQGIFSKPLFSGYPICSLYDNLFFYNKNLTSHTVSSITVGINADTDQDITVKGIAMKNFFLYVDTCDISCATCNGPSNVRKIIISNSRILNLNYFFRQTAWLALTFRHKVEVLAHVTAVMFLIYFLAC